MKPSQKYLLQELEKYSSPRLLDFACSRGSLWDVLPPHVEAFGCDIALTPEMEARVRGLEGRFRISTDPSRIPFEDAQFDIVFANSAFEHVQPIEAIIAECARVLKPDGRLIAVFPCKTVIYEPHVRVPFAQLLPEGRGREMWCQAWYALTDRAKFRSGRHVRANEYLSTSTNYLTYGQYITLLRSHFGEIRTVTEEIAKLSGRRVFLPAWFISRFYAVGIDATHAS